MCFDVGSATPAHRDLVTIRECADRDSQRLVIEDGQIKVQSTLATDAPKCLDIRSREAGEQAHIWTCRAPGVNPNRHFCIQNGHIKVADTLTTAQPMCLDFGTAFNDGAPVSLQPCAEDGSQNPGQDTAVQTGTIIARANMQQPHHPKKWAHGEGRAPTYPPDVSFGSCRRGESPSEAREPPAPLVASRIPG
ncbi:RICIN domain-containing protein [Streptomyces sp. MMS21 TC-5]|uniref:RICIN domain-containing protein n=1 Tax=Streptomyces sp. MMS21 TC-5 TaxID=2925833 RepID=UPI001F604996|nr:RICIN domain-containing protein [Streptomyces sp. MMS21 TC-5]MCI4085529.1 RICIN domain-containing protein [Streptomyces sp. MMS21 TC-5]